MTASMSANTRPIITSTGPGGSSASRAGSSQIGAATTVSPGRVAFTIATAGVAGSRPLAMPVAASSASVRAGM